MTSEPLSTASFEARAEEAIQRIVVASGSGSATRWMHTVTHAVAEFAAYPMIAATGLLLNADADSVEAKFRALCRLGVPVGIHANVDLAHCGFRVSVGDYPAAFEIARLCSERNPGRYDVASSLTFYACLSHRRKSEIRTRISDLLDRFGESPGAWHAAVYYTQNWVSVEEANQIRRAFLSRNLAHSTGIASGVVAAMRRDMAMEANNFGEAIRFGRTVVAKDPQSALGWATLAECYVTTRDVTMAQKCIERARQANPLQPCLADMTARVAMLL